MAGRVAGKVAFITGAARGQGRSHAIRLAEEGADIIAVDICEDIASVGYGLATEADLAETVKAVEALDRRIFARKADVRDLQGLKEALDAGVAELGKLDIVSANAGICTVQAWERHPGGVAGHDRHQPDRRLEHALRLDPAPARQRRRVDHRHQLDRGHQGPAVPRPVHRRQARRRRHLPVARQRAGRQEHPGQHGPPDGVDTPMMPASAGSRR